MTLALRRLPLFIGTVLASAMLTAAAPAEPKPGGTATIVLDKEAPTLLALTTTTASTQGISPKIFEGLLTYEADLAPRPQLATSWQVSPDGLEYSFALREGVAWHDGQPFTAQDAAFSILRLKEAHPRGRVTFASVEAAETPDPLTLVLRLSRPAPYLLTALAASESPIIPQHVFGALPADHVPAREELIGTGPFTVGEVVAGSHVVLEKNEAYWDQGKPYLDRLIVRVIPDAGSRAAALETGEADIGENIVPLGDVERLKGVDRVQIVASADAYAGAQRQLVFNLDNEHLRDVRVRKAIAHSVDLQTIVDLALFGYGDVSPSPISVNLKKYHDPAIEPHAFDPETAVRLLDEAGLAAGSDGRRFTLKLRYNAAADARTAEYLKQALAGVGIGVDIAASDGATYVKSVYTDRDFDLTVESLANVFDPTVGVQRVYWSKNFKVGQPFSNGAHYANARVDELLEAAAVEPDEARRAEYFREFQQIIDEELPVLNLYSPQTIISATARTRDFIKGAHGIRHNFADVYVD